MAGKADVPLFDESVHLLANHNFLRLGEFFGLEKRDDRIENKKALEEVLEWATEKSGSEDILDALLHIRGVERTIRGGDLAETRLTKLRRFIAIEKDQERIDKELDLLKGAPNEESTA